MCTIKAGRSKVAVGPIVIQSRVDNILIDRADGTRVLESRQTVRYLEVQSAQYRQCVINVLCELDLKSVIDRAPDRREKRQAGCGRISTLEGAKRTNSAKIIGGR